MKSCVRTAAAFAVASAMLAFSGQSHATVFAAWQVAGVPFGDTLNARKYPSNTSQKQAAFPNGTVLQMTGRCTDGIDLHDIASQPHWKAAARDPLLLVRGLARSGAQRSFRRRLGLRQIHHTLLTPLSQRPGCLLVATVSVSCSLWSPGSFVLTAMAGQALVKH